MNLVPRLFDERNVYVWERGRTRGACAIVMLHACANTRKDSCTQHGAPAPRREQKERERKRAAAMSRIPEFAEVLAAEKRRPQ